MWSVSLWAVWVTARAVFSPLPGPQSAQAAASSLPAPVLRRLREPLCRLRSRVCPRLPAAGAGGLQTPAHAAAALRCELGCCWASWAPHPLPCGWVQRWSIPLSCPERCVSLSWGCLHPRGLALGNQRGCGAGCLWGLGFLSAQGSLQAALRLFTCWHRAQTGTGWQLSVGTGPSTSTT